MATKSKQGITWNKNKIYALIVILFLVLLSIYIGLSCASWISQNSDLEKPRTFHIAYGANYNDSSGPINPTPEHTDDVIFDLTVTYPRSTLVVNDKVTISGIARVYSFPVGYDLASMTMGFENAQAYPVAPNNDGITQSSNLYFFRVGDTNEYVANATCCTWQVEGTYRTYLAFIIRNGNTGFMLGPRLNQNMALTVNPQSVLAQITTNNVSIGLTIALYALTVVGTLTLFLTLWDRGRVAGNSTNNSANKGTKDSSNTHIDNNPTKSPIEKQGNNKTEKDKDSTQHATAKNKK